MVSCCSSRYRWFYRQGNFFILYGDYHKNRFTLSLGPNWVVFLSMWICALIYTVNALRAPVVFQQSFFVTVLYVLVHFLFLISFFITGTFDAGVIRKTEDNSLEHGGDLESLGFSYCSICDLYRPKDAHHCSLCGVCFYNHDHHCGIMGQCIARNNLWTFYTVITTLILTQCFHIFLGTGMFLYRNKYILSYYRAIGRFLHII